jgi:hypothetical protein
MKMKLTVTDYRHVAIGFKRKIKGILIRRIKIKIKEQQKKEDNGKNLTTEERREEKKIKYI